MMMRMVGMGGVCYLAVSVTLAAGSTAPARLDTSAAIDKADACGSVVDSAGHAVPDVMLTASAGNFKVSATTISDGSFSLPETSTGPMLLEAEARGFSRASRTISHLSGAGERKCKHPLYVVLAGTGGASFMTMNKKDLPKGSR